MRRATVVTHDRTPPGKFFSARPANRSRVVSHVSRRPHAADSHPRAAEGKGRRSVYSALVWGIGLPVIAIGLLLAGFWPVAVIALMAYPLQVLRLARRGDIPRGLRWVNAFFLVHGLPGMFQNILSNQIKPHFEKMKLNYQIVSEKFLPIEEANNNSDANTKDSSSLLSHYFIDGCFTPEEIGEMI